ncbi:hypothetical protein BS50DRAFT_660618 [Corynespora cassiicola Philippines]|uniref:Uncharacterized protein n=1 Tax=Corynespora cassiicola Philippines TaxID=1448308 RepID=A0A2T2P198_CORCC|nr:hypothetical protein BS50DRAFT_660618 [Corynespora cassiicola Philippines]
MSGKDPEIVTVTRYTTIAPGFSPKPQQPAPDKSKNEAGLVTVTSYVTVQPSPIVTSPRSSSQVKSKSQGVGTSILTSIAATSLNPALPTGVTNKPVSEPNTAEPTKDDGGVLFLAIFMVVMCVFGLIMTLSYIWFIFRLWRGKCENCAAVEKENKELKRRLREIAVDDHPTVLPWMVDDPPPDSGLNYSQEQPTEPKRNAHHEKALAALEGKKLQRSLSSPTSVHPALRGFSAKVQRGKDLFTSKKSNTRKQPSTDVEMAQPGPVFRTYEPAPRNPPRPAYQPSQYSPDISGNSGRYAMKPDWSNHEERIRENPDYRSDQPIKRRSRAYGGLSDPQLPLPPEPLRPRLGPGPEPGPRPRPRRGSLGSIWRK